MGEEKASFSKIFESLLSKSIEANKVFLKEGGRIFEDLSKSKNNTNFLNILNNEVVKDSFNEFVKINTNHLNNMIDFSLKFVDKMKNSDSSESTTAADIEEPSFILEKSVEAGNIVNFQFLLDNVKTETVKCELIHNGYTLQSDVEKIENFNTEFSPQSFELKEGEAKPVMISILIPANTNPGFYKNNVQVKGFEPAYFSIQLTVTEKVQEDKSNASKKTK